VRVLRATCLLLTLTLFTTPLLALTRASPPVPQERRVAALNLSLLFSRLGGELRALFGALGSSMDPNGRCEVAPGAGWPYRSAPSLSLFREPSCAAKV
jgi:hypothetical protein